MAIVERQRAHGVTFYVVFRFEGKLRWERSGTDRREAERLDKRRRKEVSDGTYMPHATRGAATVRSFAAEWIAKRTNRTADDERRWLERYVLADRTLAPMPIAAVRPRHIEDFIRRLKKATSTATHRPLSEKSVANVYGVMRTMFRDARVQEYTQEDPCALPKGAINRKSKVRRQPYTKEAAAALVSPAVQVERRMWNALAFYTGMRCGEVCGRRFQDWERDAKPLGCLVVDTQYEGKPLKTDNPRRVPVHPELDRLMTWWQAEGFETVHGRRPRPEDYIVPARHMGPHTKSSAYKGWIKSCAEAEVMNRSVHSTRHTFISSARRGGARKDVVERITHNAGGDIVDEYTHWDWAPLCEAVQCVPPFDVAFDAPAGGARIRVEAPGIEAGQPFATIDDSTGGDDVEPPRRAQNVAESGQSDAELAAHQTAPTFTASFDAADAYAARLAGKVSP